MINICTLQEIENEKQTCSGIGLTISQAAALTWIICIIQLNWPSVLKMMEVKKVNDLSAVPEFTFYHKIIMCTHRLHSGPGISFHTSECSTNLALVLIT